MYISMEAKKILKLDEIWWIVTPKNPLKIINPAIYKERINNCKNITKNKPIKIVEIEKKINSKFSYQTINYINNHYKHIKFFWLMGADNLINFHKWQKWKDIFNDMAIVVFRRHGYNTKALKSHTSHIYKNYKIDRKNLSVDDFIKLPAWTLIQNKEIKVSSTEIRKQRELLRFKN